MAYGLHAITPADRDKILADVAADPRKLRWFEYAVTAGTASQTWALDRERNYYLVCMPMRIREEFDRQPYWAYIDGHMYVLARGGLFSDAIYFDEDMLPPAAVLAIVQKEVTAAFAVYGGDGLGPVDAYGTPEVFVPRFVERMPLDPM